MRNVYLFTFFLAVTLVSILGVRGTGFTHPPMDVFPEWAFPAMRHQSKFKPETADPFFADNRADRPPPAGVVAASDAPAADDALVTGKNPDGSFVRGFPAEITVNLALLERGRDRFGVYCTPCHGLVGDGNGVTKHYGMGATLSYHDDRLRQMAEGELFNTITGGKQPANNMPPYADKLTPRDRWAVIAYIRALQRAQNGRVTDVPPDHRSELGLP